MRTEMDESKDFAIFCQNQLFTGMSEEKIRLVYSVSEEIILEPDMCLIRENETSKDFFLIMEGDLRVAKHIEKYKEIHHLTILHAGDSVGEVAFLDREARTADVCALTRARVRRVSFEQLQKLVEQDPSLYRLFFQLSKNISQRLRETNKQIIQATELNLEELKTRIFMGNCFVYLVIALCLFTLFLPKLTLALTETATTSFVTLPVTLFGLIFIYLGIQSSPLPLSAFGLTWNGWKRSLYEGVIYTIPLLIFATAVKWIGMQFGYPSPHLFNVFKGIAGEQLSPTIGCIALVLYWLLIAPLQELIARGCLQSSLEYLLIGKRKNLMAIAISNLVFCTFHAFLSPFISLLVFIPGLFFGWLFSRTHNLIGVWMAHALTGTWGLFILGV